MKYYNIEIAVKITYSNIQAETLEEAKKIVKSEFENDHKIKVETKKMKEV